jgi:hypothetical protein
MNNLLSDLTLSNHVIDAEGYVFFNLLLCRFATAIDSTDGMIDRWLNKKLQRELQKEDKMKAKEEKRMK